MSDLFLKRTGAMLSAFGIIFHTNAVFTSDPKGASLACVALGIGLGLMTVK